MAKTTLMDVFDTLVIVTVLHETLYFSTFGNVIFYPIRNRGKGETKKTYLVYKHILFSAPKIAFLVIKSQISSHLNQ